MARGQALAQGGRKIPVLCALCLSCLLVVDQSLVIQDAGQRCILTWNILRSLWTAQSLIPGVGFSCTSWILLVRPALHPSASVLA